MTISIDRIKPAFLDDIKRQSVKNRDVLMPSEIQIERNDERASTNDKNVRSKYVTDSGRRVRFPDRLQTGFR